MVLLYGAARFCTLSAPAIREEEPMPQALVCSKCKEPFVFTGAGIELIDDVRLAYRHSCGALNELEYFGADERGRGLYRIMGVVRDLSYVAPPLQAPPTRPAAPQ
jgi:hypothetical protein